MAFIEKNKPEFDRMIKADEDAMASQMPSNLFEMLGALAGGQPPGPGQVPEAPKEGSAPAGASEKGARKA